MLHPLGEVQVKFSVVDERPTGTVILHRDLVWYGRDRQAGEYRQSRIDISHYDIGFIYPFEKVNVLSEYPEIADKLIHLTERHKSEFFDR